MLAEDISKFQILRRKLGVYHKLIVCIKQLGCSEPLLPINGENFPQIF